MTKSVYEKMNIRIIANGTERLGIISQTVIKENHEPIWVVFCSDFKDPYDPTIQLPQEKFVEGFRNMLRQISFIEGEALGELRKIVGGYYWDSDKKEIKYPFGVRPMKNSESTYLFDAGWQPTESQGNSIDEKNCESGWTLFVDREYSVYPHSGNNFQILELSFPNQEYAETRSLLQATYTPRKPKPEERHAKVSRGLEKGAFFSYLAPTEEELNKLKHRYTEKLAKETNETAAIEKDIKTTEIILSALYTTGRINILTSAKQFATVEIDTLYRVAKDIVEQRRAVLDTISDSHKAILEKHTKALPQEKSASPTPDASVKDLMEWAIKNNIETESAHKTIELGKSLSFNLQEIKPNNFKSLASRHINRLSDRVDGCEESLAAEHIGYLHLERMSFTPAGIERGRLVHSVPLSPGEEVNIRQREWSRTTEEFERIVTDYLEEFSEQGVTEKTELAQSVDSQKQHSNAFNTAVSTSGEAWGFSITASVGYNASESASKSEKITRNHTRELTSKASSRSKQEHKISFRVASARETEDETVQRIKNPFPDRATRVDYYQLIRKWQVELYRYGIRLTYDIAIPEPGSGLLGILREIQKLQEKLTRPFELEKLLELKASELSLNEEDDNYYGKIALEHGIVMTEKLPPLFDKLALTFDKDCTDSFGTEKCQEGWVEDPIYETIKKEIPSNYEVCKEGNKKVLINIIQRWRSKGGKCEHYLYSIRDQLWGRRLYEIKGGTHDVYNDPPGATGWAEDECDGCNGWIYKIPEYELWAGYQGALAVNVTIWNMAFVGFSIIVPLRLKASVEQEWKQKIWNQFHEFMIARYYEERQLDKERLDVLTEKLGAQDALSLRKKEREEVMKGVLRFLICSDDFEFFPDNIFQPEDIEKGSDIEQILYGVETGLLKINFREDLLAHGEAIKFLHHAIEWENMLYFLYPYFWTHPTRWDFKKYLDHPDPTHRAFLRAGSARVVLTIRQGFEDAFLAFINTGNVNDLPPSPYLEIGQEFRNYANTNYPGIPPANPVGNFRPLLYPKQEQAWVEIQFIMKLLEEYHDLPTPNQKQAWEDMKVIFEFLEEYRNDKPEYPSTLEDLVQHFPNEAIPMTDPWNNEYLYTYPGIHGRYDLVSYGADGQPGGEGENADITSWEEQYPGSLDTLEESFPDEKIPRKDPWGNDYIYAYPGNHGKYDLLSYGADDKPGGEDENADITSWAEASLIGQWYEYTPTIALDIAFDEELPNK
jgi:hypothetical protein